MRSLEKIFDSFVNWLMLILGLFLVYYLISSIASGHVVWFSNRGRITNNIFTGIGGIFFAIIGLRGIIKSFKKG